MMTAVLPPIHPGWADLIYAGAKTVEVRRRFNPKTEGMTVLFYETRPVGMVTGCAVIAAVRPTPVGELPCGTMTRRTRIPRPELLGYADGAMRIAAIGLKDARRFDGPLRLSELGIGRAPQNYRYVEWEEGNA